MEMEAGMKRQSETRLVTRRQLLICGGAAIGGVTLKMGWGALVAEAKGNMGKEVSIVHFSDAGQRQDTVKMPVVVKTEAGWKQQLSEGSFEVTRHAATERAYSGATWNNHDKGLYRCICCGTALFSSDTKFDSGTGWPSFWQPIARENVHENGDYSLGMVRTEVTCRLCEGHLGHVFDDGPRPTGLRYCMNSLSLRFVKNG
jgi:peptide-methionine (R)-S-oxide reductase